MSTRLDPEHVLAFDLETTDKDPLAARIVTSALVAVDGATVRPTTWLADPGVSIPAAATEIHGITTERARAEGRPHEDVVAEVVAALRAGWAEGRAVVVFNAPFDLTILRRFDPDFSLDGLVVDPYVIDRALDPYRRGSRTLTAMCETHGVRLDGAHDAAADALAAARRLWKLTRLHPTLVETDATELMDLQTRWHGERQRDFAAYLRRQGRDSADVDDRWPVRA